MDAINQINVRTGDAGLNGIDPGKFEASVIRAIRAEYPESTITVDVIRNTDTRTEVSVSGEIDARDERELQEEIYDLVQYTYKSMCEKFSPSEDDNEENVHSPGTWE